MQTLLDTAIETFGSKDLSTPVNWEDTFIQVPGHAGFDIEPENCTRRQEHDGNGGQL